MKTSFSLCTLFLCAIVALTGCDKNNELDPNPDPNELVSLSIEFDNIVGGQNLILNTPEYTNAVGEKFNVSLLQYFISNIKLRKTDGSWFTVNQDSSYFLINESDASTHDANVKVPAADYNQLSFTVGVDSLRSTMGIDKRTGVLDPSSGHDGMYWGWNSGYIFFKLEGISPAAPLDPTGQRKFRFHIGGFGGMSAPTINNIKTITLDLTAGGIAQARKGRNANIHLMVDILKAMNGTTNVSIAANPAVMFSDYSLNVSNNYSSMFTHDHTEN
jgi:hypothetical protein